MSTFDSFLSDLTPEQRERLQLLEVSLPHGQRKPLAELVAAWVAHVRRLRSEATALAGQDAWSEHDYVAALHIRDLIEGAFVDIPHDARDSVEVVTRGVDGDFKEFTEPDHERLLDRLTGESVRTRGWWWQRVPRQGPVLEGLKTVESGKH